MAVVAGQKLQHRHSKQRKCRRTAPCLWMILVVVWLLFVFLTWRNPPTDIEPWGHGKLQQKYMPPLADARFQFLQRGLDIFDSDVVELRHCNLRDLNWKDYFAWASVILDEKMPQFRADPVYANFSEWAAMEQEFTLELLEMYATHNRQCRFDTGFPFLPPELHGKEAMLSGVPAAPAEYARLFIVIVAFHDAAHLRRLVEAVHMPHHCIAIHLERRASDTLVGQVQELASSYSNVVVVQFGTIVYRTDSISMIQLQLMKWSLDHFKYDYYVALCGAAYPLQAAPELARRLRESSREVYMGELTHGRIAARVRTSQEHLLTGKKRLIYTRGNSTKAAFRVSSSLIQSNGFDTTSIDPYLREALSYKANSGNQAIYSYSTVAKLVSSPQVLSMFALAKYGCCVGLEERTWIAAMHIIGLVKQALEQGGIWQVWGGQPTCGSSVSNAILSASGNVCFKVEDASRGIERNDTTLYIRGNQVMDYLTSAKRRGFLFARKFQSDNHESMALLQKIKTELHSLYGTQSKRLR